MLHVRAACLLNRVVVPVDDFVEVEGRNLSDLVQAFEVIALAILVHEGREGDRGQVADRDLVRRSVLDDLGTQIRAVDRAEVLLVRLPVTVVLVEHVRSTGLHLRLQNAEPQLLGLHILDPLAVGLQLDVLFLELLAPKVHETDARLGVNGLVRAEQGPLPVVFDPLHEEVRDPKRVEEITCPLLLFAVVLLQLEEVEDVRMPGLQVHGEGSFSLAAALVNIAGGLVEVAEHGDQAVTVPVGAADVAALGTDVGDGNTDASGALGDQSALLQGVVDAVDAVRLHGEQEARRHLRSRCACIEKSRRRVSEPPAGHEVVGLEGCGQISRVNAAGDTHDHVLRALDDLTMDSEKVGLLQGLEAEVVVIEIPGIVHGGIKCGAIVADKLPDFLRNERRISALLVGVLEQRSGSLREGIRRVLMQVGHRNPRRQS
mmetsp:Transcript_43278/g.109704  ORF Transcript_43278/g.109704 Transcript_43278/m.109704 type:complete len:430 (-) Transcript_43278:280-1569(-)